MKAAIIDDLAACRGEIREKDGLAALAFVTTSLDHAVESFGVRACGYLVKPLSYEKQDLC